MFSHNILFTPRVRVPSIFLFIFILRSHVYITSVIVVTRRSIIFMEHFISHLITVNHSGTDFHLCSTGSQRVMLSKWTHFHIWTMKLTHLSNWFITGCHGVREAGSNVVTCFDNFGPFFGILDKSVWRRTSLTAVSFLLYDMHVNCSNLQQTEPWSNSISCRSARASRWFASLSWKGLSPFWLRVII